MSGPSGHKKNKFDDADFLAIDGEGITLPDGKHIYTLLHASDGTYIENWSGNGLTTKQCLRFLCELATRHPFAIFVMFSGWYDANMWLGDCERDNIAALWALRDDDTNYSPVWDDDIKDTTYEANFLPRKYYKVRVCKQHPAFVESGRKKPDGSPEWRRNVLAEACIWDVWGFFATSFVKACESYGLSVSDDIRSGKGKRGSFTPSDKADIRDYCYQECLLLVELMDRLRDALKAANLRVKRWDGAGAVAASLLQREKVKDHKEEFSEEVFDAARGAMAGGRIECLKYGVIDKPLYGYDINSAYPAVYPKLPSLAGGEWEYRDDGTYGEYALCYVRWEFPDGDALYPYHYRDSRGNISYPQYGEGWQWSVVVDAAHRQRPRHTTILASYTFHSRNDDKPFSFVRGLFNERKRLKAEGNAAEKAIKLGINSLYGKTAQQKGARKLEDGTIQRPPYFQLEWAGYVTASVRATLYETAMQSPDNIVFIATDGIVSLCPLGVQTGSGLGEWEAYQCNRATVAQSGVYWLHKDGEWVHHYRGFDEHTITRERVETALAAGVEAITAQQTRFVTMGRALVGEDSWQTWRHWETREKKLRLTPLGTKRELVGRNKGIRATRAYLPPEAAVGTPSELFPIEWLDGKDAMPEAYKMRDLASSDVTE